MWRFPAGCSRFDLKPAEPVGDLVYYMICRIGKKVRIFYQKPDKNSLFSQMGRKGQAVQPNRSMKKCRVTRKNGLKFIGLPQNGIAQNGGSGFFSSYAGKGLFETANQGKIKKDRLKGLSFLLFPYELAIFHKSVGAEPAQRHTQTPTSARRLSHPPPHGIFP